METYPNIKYVHPIKNIIGNSGVVRIFDPDNHMIEIGEAMDVVLVIISNYKSIMCIQKDIDEVSRIMSQYPIDYVSQNIFKI